MQAHHHLCPAGFRQLPVLQALPMKPNHPGASVEDPTNGYHERQDRLESTNVTLMDLARRLMNPWCSGRIAMKTLQGVAWTPLGFIDVLQTITAKGSNGQMPSPIGGQTSCTTATPIPASRIFRRMEVIWGRSMKKRAWSVLEVLDGEMWAQVGSQLILPSLWIELQDFR
jgi:hypothetical protein